MISTDVMFSLSLTEVAQRVFLIPVTGYEERL
jgi:hypothetical protein